ncbi:MAG: hypothetical protein C5S49_03340 [Candidatus Methanogaster sp.]|nr:MAG: hypothetical protein C5S49_03340 [ANME-2 cluster archaeon]
MVNAKEIIEKMWWVIPPMAVLFGIPLFHTYREILTFGLPISSFVDIYIKCAYLYLVKGFFSFATWFIIISTSVSICIGYYITMKRSLSLRITIPTITGFFGYLTSLLLVAMIYAI